MNRVDSEEILSKVPNYQENALAVSRGIHDRILAGGESTRRVADLLHGVWLGHPLHPVLTDLTLGAWILGTFFDVIGLGKDSRRANEAADTLITLGTISAVPTALSGLTDYSTIRRGAVTTGATHGLLNSLAFVLFGLSSFNRSRDNRGLGQLLSSIGLGMITVSAWLGGELTFRHRIGVNKAEQPQETEQWTEVLEDEKLEEQKPRRVKVDGQPVLMYRYQGKINAIGAVCPHEGGPLEKGSFDGFCVECPWHQSVFDLRDGSVVHGPTTYAVPAYDVRVRDGKIQVRLR